MTTMAPASFFPVLLVTYVAFLSCSVDAGRTSQKIPRRSCPSGPWSNMCSLSGAACRPSCQMGEIRGSSLCSNGCTCCYSKRTSRRITTSGKCQKKTSSQCLSKGGKCRKKCNNRFFQRTGLCSGTCKCCIRKACRAKQGCVSSGGRCVNLNTPCDGRVKAKGCTGSTCVCCIPRVQNVGKPKRKCIKKGGACKATCSIGEAEVPNGCKGRTHLCCFTDDTVQTTQKPIKTIPPGSTSDTKTSSSTGNTKPSTLADKCLNKNKQKCKKKGGQCQTSLSCNGEVVDDGCRGSCTCCVSTGGTSGTGEPSSTMSTRDETAGTTIAADKTTSSTGCSVEGTGASSSSSLSSLSSSTAGTTLSAASLPSYGTTINMTSTGNVNTTGTTITTGSTTTSSTNPSTTTRSTTTSSTTTTTITTSTTTTTGSTTPEPGCSLNSVVYDEGHILESLCFKMLCENETWVNQGMQKPSICAPCVVTAATGSVFTFDTKFYLHSTVPCTYSLAQKGTDTSPEYYTYLELDPKPVSVTFKEENAEEVICSLGDTIKGCNIGDLTETPTEVQPGVLGFTYNSLAVLMGSNIMITYNSATFLVYVPKSRQYTGEVGGMCGNYNGDEEDELVPREGGDPVEVEEFAASWTTDTCD